MAETEFERRFEALEARVLWLENYLGKSSRPQATLDVLLDKDRRAKGWHPAPIAPTAPPPLPPPLPALVISEPAQAVVDATPPAPSAPPARDFNLERALGLKWAGWIGAIVLIIGAALGVRYIYEQGWFLVMPPAVRLAMIAAGGIALLAAGEFVYRRIDRIPGASLMGAGVATLFLASYAGNAYYKLYDPTMALLLTAAVTLIGAAVARRGNLVAIAVLSIVGGNLIPLLISTAHPHLIPFLFYLLMLQTVALSLAYLGATPKWWTLRGLSLAGITFWMIGVLLNHDFVGQITSLLIFSAVFALAFQAELVASALRRTSARKLIRVYPTDAGEHFSLLVTGLLTVAVLWILRDQSTSPRTLAVLILAALCAVAAKGLRGATGRLALGYIVQAAALLVVAAPVALSGLWLVICWAILALAFAVVGAATDRKISRVAGIITWILAALDALHYVVEPYGHLLHNLPWITILGQGITPALTVCWIVALLGQAIAWLTSEQQDDRKDERAAAWFIAAASACLWAVASMMVLPPLGATLSLVVLAWILAMADVASDKISWAVQAAAVLLFASVKWVVIDALADRFSPDWSASAHSALFNSMMAMALLLSVSLPAIYWLRRSSLQKILRADSGNHRQANLLFAMWWVVISIMTVGLSLQMDLLVERAVAHGQKMSWPGDQFKQFLLTILWAASATAIWAAAKIADRSNGGDKRSQASRWLTALLACKYLIFDTLMWRLDQAPGNALVLLNVQTLAGTVLLAALIIQRRGSPRILIHRIGGFIAVLILLWIGTLEIDRAFQYPLHARFYHPDRAEEVAISIFWAIFAVGCVAAGFKARVAALRYFGLGLFAVTLAKVVVVDLAQIGAGYRILSFMGLGLLMLGTSVLYGKLSPKLLGEPPKEK